MTAARSAPSRASGLAVLIFLVLVCSPCLGLGGALAYQANDGPARFTRWRSLGAPPEAAVAFVAADPMVVYVETETGTVYACRPKRASSDGACWQPAAAPYDIDPEADFEHSVYSGDVPPPPGETRDVVFVSIFYADAAFEARYALLADGTIWVWEYSASSNLALLVLLAGPVVGLALGLVVIVILLIANARAQRGASAG
ncbi:MAG: hypothetical protein IT317_16995 [Anaerolineales bacterium]|nr:hypothetical protein [Anaerolineales bacterium]